MNKKTFTTKRKPSSKKAFSLIELSIVLIIIGLLIAGVTGGASLIKNAELRGVMNEARGYQTAVNSFYARFNALPGDYGTAIGASGNGDANGQIEFKTDKESNIALLQLRNGSFIDNNFTLNATDAALTPGSSIPASKLKNAGWVFGSTSASANYVIITKAIAALTTATNELGVGAIVGVLTPSDALSIDIKSDDGVYGTGNVTASGTASGSCASSYDTSRTTADCSSLFKLDPTA